MTMPTTESVQALLSVEFTAATINAAITDAALMVEDCGYTDSREEAIVRYLAAHLLSSSQPGGAGNVKSENIDGTAYTLGGAVVGMGLKGSSFGQQALLLDKNRCLQDIDTKQARMDLL